jgi:hypothetical protein
MTEVLAPETSEQWGVFLRQVGGDEGIGEPVAESALADQESRLGRVLPSDYRNFLATTDGYDGELFCMYSAADAGWVREVMPKMIEAWEDFDDVVEMLQRCALVGEDGSNAYYLLDPAPSGDGWTAIEWWTTPSEVTGYPTFGALAAALIRQR